MSSGDILNKIERRVTTVEEAVKLLTDLALRADERMDALGAAQVNSEAKIAALADSQIKLEAAQANSEAMIAALANSQIRLEAAQANSEAMIAALADSHIRLEAAQANANEKIGALADAQIRTEERLARLAEARANKDAKNGGVD